MVKFKVSGLTRFLSHAETLRMLHRAFIRAEIDMVYSGGFNPRPRLSLPLPRSVGVESEDELCLIEISRQSAEDFGGLIKKIADQLPEGIEIISAEIAVGKPSFNSGAVTYIFSVSDGAAVSSVQDKINELMKKQQCILDRYSPDSLKPRQVDVRQYLQSIDVSSCEILVHCVFGPSGTVRIDEMMQLFGLDSENLSKPVRRVKVDWVCN